MLELCHYIHNNPLKENTCQSLDQYPWSSHKSYSGKTKLAWLNTKYIKKLLTNHLDIKQDPYHHFMQNFKNITEKTIYCSFDENGELTVSDFLIDKMKNTSGISLENVPLQDIIQVIRNYLGISKDVIFSGTETHNFIFARPMIVYFGRYHARYFLRNIGGLLNRKPDSLTKNLRWCSSSDLI